MVNLTRLGGGGAGGDETGINRQAVRYLEAGRLGGLPEGQGKSGRAGSGRADPRRLREGSQGKPIQDLEPDVVGIVLPTSGAGGGDTKTAWRRKPEYSACPRLRTGSRKRSWPGIWRRWSNRSSTRIPTATD